MVGPVSYNDLPRYYRVADIYCSPATGFESLGIVLLEAMSAGKPIVASDIAGYATVVEDGAQGLLVEPKDDQALAAALLKLINNPQVRQQMGARGRAHSERYSWPRVSAQVLDYYQGLLEEREPGRIFREE